MRINVQRVPEEPECHADEGHRSGLDKHGNSINAGRGLKHLFSEQQRDRRDHRQYVPGQFGPGKREKYKRHHRPGQQDVVVLAERPPQSRDQNECPWKRQKQQDGQEKEDRPVMAMNRADESFEILIDEEYLDELPAVDSSTQDIPWSRNRDRYPQPFKVPGLPLISFASQPKKHSEGKGRQNHGDG